MEAWQTLARQTGFAESALPFRVGAQSNWSTYLVQRFFATGGRRDLDTALAHWEEALAMVSPLLPTASCFSITSEQARRRCSGPPPTPSNGEDDSPI